MQEDLIGRWHKTYFTLFWGTRTIEGRRLTKRQVFCESRCGTLLGCTYEKSQECATGRIGTIRTASEIGGNVRPAESLFQKRLVALRTTEKHGNPVECHACFREQKGTSRNLHRFQSLARSSEDLYGSIIFTCRRLLKREEMT